MRYEAAANVAYEPYDVCALCPYDSSRLPDAVLQSARQTHPQTLVGSTTEPSPTFADPRAFVRRHSEIERPPADALELPLESTDDIAPARERVAQLAATAGLASSRTEELTVALSEVAANALAHGAAPRRLRVYTSDGAVVCHVHDAGQGPADPLAGYLLPDPMGLGGRGLWLAHQLCDIVEASCDQAGAQVSLRVSLDSAR